MLRKFVRQLRPTQEKYVAPIEKVQNHFGFLSELTISPTYVMKGVENPFYDLDIDVEKDIKPAVGKGDIKFKNVNVSIWQSLWRATCLITSSVCNITNSSTN